ncbi:MAG TPA: hypothetical protein PK537_11935, partial [Candidatus Limiplasma sp.]|nr:hypothetical protein [Candidatus Limiplasma sp.]
MNDEFAVSNRRTMHYWLLRLEFTSSDQQFNPDELEFCITDDGFCVYFPLQIGNQLSETDDGLVLSM